MESEYVNETYFQHLHDIAIHYDIFKGLYSDLGFFPAIKLNVKYFPATNSNVNNFPATVKYLDKRGDVLTVERGNYIPASEVQFEPTVDFDFQHVAEKGDLFTLVMSSLDSNVMATGEGEILHWMLGNIQSNKDLNLRNDTNLVVPYSQLFPARSTGYHRIVFVLYKHSSELDLAEYRVSDLPGREFITRRLFSSLSFFNNHSPRGLQPVGLAFFQTCWDLSVREFFHNKLKTEEPVYDYDWPEPIYPQQKAFPEKKSFWKYLDRYKDRKELAEEVVRDRIAKEEPLKEVETSIQLANVDKISHKMPTWWREVEQLRRLRKGKFHDEDPV